MDGLPAGVTLSSPVKRLGGWLMEYVVWIVASIVMSLVFAAAGSAESVLLALITVALLLAFAAWYVYLMTKGRTPGKEILGMTVVNSKTGRPASFGRMLLRDLIAKPIIGTFSLILLGIPNFWLVWDKDNQELWDKMVDTVVVDDPHRQLASNPAPPSPAAPAPSAESAI